MIKCKVDKFLDNCIDEQSDQKKIFKILTYQYWKMKDKNL